MFQSLILLQVLDLNFAIFSKLTRLVQKEKSTITSKSDDDTSENESNPSRKGKNSISSPAKSTKAQKRHHASESEDAAEEIPKTRSRTNVERIDTADSKASKRKSSSGERSKTAKKSKDGAIFSIMRTTNGILQKNKLERLTSVFFKFFVVDIESDSEEENEVNTRSMRSSNQKYVP